jgi:branched-chain amino acid transport system permease protein
MLLDEVASGLDEAELTELDSLISAARAAGATVLLVEHNFELVRGLSDHVVVLADGRLLAEGSADEIAENDDVKHIYFGGNIGHYEPSTVEVAP